MERLPVEGFEKEISSLMRKLESRKGRGGKKKSLSVTHLKRAS